jgi:hypothetical protein
MVGFDRLIFMSDVPLGTRVYRVESGGDENPSPEN